MNESDECRKIFVKDKRATFKQKSCYQFYENKKILQFRIKIEGFEKFIVNSGKK